MSKGAQGSEPPNDAARLLRTARQRSHAQRRTTLCAEPEPQVSFLWSLMIIFLSGPIAPTLRLRLAGVTAEVSAASGRCSEPELLKHRKLKAARPRATHSDHVRRAGKIGSRRIPQKQDAQ